MSFLLFFITEAFPATPEYDSEATGRIGIDYFEAMRKENNIWNVHTSRCLIIKDLGVLLQMYS